ncbi:MAG: tol-pal system YbgF family protein [Candidatus Scalinduaceae bacterium]
MNNGNKDIKTNEIKPDAESEKTQKTTGVNNDEKLELKKMSEGLEKERKELEKLKTEFQRVSQSNKKIEEDKMENNITSSNTDGKITENKETISNVQNSVEPSVDKSEKVEVDIKKDEEIINPLEIAESLYKLGEYKTSLDIYELANKNDLDDERKLWISYQIANCCRKLKLFDKALKVYKKIQDEHEGTYWAKQAKWYINDIEWQTEVQDELKTVVGK